MIFKEINESGDIILPGNIKVKDIDVSKEELSIYEKEMNSYSFKVLNLHTIINFKNKELNKRDVSKYYLDLSDLDDYFKPIFLVQNHKFIGVCISVTYSHHLI